MHRSSRHWLPITRREAAGARIQPGYVRHDSRCVAIFVSLLPLGPDSMQKLSCRLAFVAVEIQELEAHAIRPRSTDSRAKRQYVIAAGHLRSTLQRQVDNRPRVPFFGGHNKSA